MKPPLTRCSAPLPLQQRTLPSSSLECSKVDLIQLKTHGWNLRIQRPESPLHLWHSLPPDQLIFSYFSTVLFLCRTLCFNFLTNLPLSIHLAFHPTKMSNTRLSFVSAEARLTGLYCADEHRISCMWFCAPPENNVIDVAYHHICWTRRPSLMSRHLQRPSWAPLYPGER